jgi:hypothetical protein
VEFLAVFCRLRSIREAPPEHDRRNRKKPARSACPNFENSAAESRRRLDGRRNVGGN